MNEGARIVELEREVHRLRCDARRLVEDLEEAQLRSRVLERIITQQGRRLLELEPEV